MATVGGDVSMGNELLASANQVRTPEEIRAIASECKTHLFGCVHTAQLIFRSLVDLSDPSLPQVDYAELEKAIREKRAVEEKEKRKVQQQTKVKEVEKARKMEKSYLDSYRKHLSKQGQWECSKCRCLNRNIITNAMGKLERERLCAKCRGKRDVVENRLVPAQVEIYDDRDPMWTCGQGQCAMPSGLNSCINHRHITRPPPSSSRGSTRTVPVAQQLGMKVFQELTKGANTTIRALRLYKTLFSDHHTTLAKAFQTLEESALAAEAEEKGEEKGNGGDLASLRAEKAMLEGEMRQQNETMQQLVDRLRNMQRDIAISIAV